MVEARLRAFALTHLLRRLVAAIFVSRNAEKSIVLDEAGFAGLVAMESES